MASFTFCGMSDEILHSSTSHANYQPNTTLLQYYMSAYSIVNKRSQ